MVSSAGPPLQTKFTYIVLLYKRACNEHTRERDISLYCIVYTRAREVPARRARAAAATLDDGADRADGNRRTSTRCCMNKQQLQLRHAEH